MLHFAVLHFAVLHFAVLHLAVLQFAVLHQAVQLRLEAQASQEGNFLTRGCPAHNGGTAECNCRCHVRQEELEPIRQQNVIAAAIWF